METYKQILRYEQAGISQREIAKILAISRNTVSNLNSPKICPPFNFSQAHLYNR
ncbi:winged helix-turn-helix transcriptional regulator, partial [Atopobacter sp. AH10]|uniref:helix-turn-helix domain-containing protein n=1 Tax=Atopobacter sp. AH10 TaxID=2315861 RepID=UPI000EF29159